MAVFKHVKKFSQRHKKWEHFKLKCRKTAFRLSLLLNYGLVIYIANEHGELTNIYESLLPWWDWLKTMLPL